MLDFALHNQLFELSHLKAAETPEGRAKLLDTVKEEFRAIQKEKKEARQEYILQLMALTLSKREITRNCIEKKLVPNPNPECAYQLVRKDIIRMTRQMRQEDLEYLPMARGIYKRQMGRLLRDATAGAQKALANEEEPDLRSYAQLLRVIKEAADAIAVINRVDITGRQQEVQKGFDLASEAARAVIDLVRQRRELEGPEEEDEGQQITDRDREEALDVGGVE